MYLTSFIDYLQYEKRSSQHTIIAYQNDLNQFQQFVVKTYKLHDITKVTGIQIRSWIVYLLTQENNSARTIHRKLASLKAFFQYLLGKNLLETDPTQQVIAPKMGKRLATFIPEVQLEQLFSTVEFADDYKGQRNRLILELLYATGMRRSELINLTINNIDFTSRVLYVTGKRKKQRLIPFTAHLAALLEDFIAIRTATFPETTLQELLLTDKGKVLYPKMVYTVVHRHLSLVTTVEQRSPHVLRHSFATHLSDRGAELNAVKELLGHSSLAATEVYMHNTIEKLKQIYELAHPKAKKE